MPKSLYMFFVFVNFDDSDATNIERNCNFVDLVNSFSKPMILLCILLISILFLCVNFINVDDLDAKTRMVQTGPYCLRLAQIKPRLAHTCQNQPKLSQINPVFRNGRFTAPLFGRAVGHVAVSLVCGNAVADRCDDYWCVLTSTVCDHYVDTPVLLWDASLLNTFRYV